MRSRGPVQVDPQKGIKVWRHSDPRAPGRNGQWSKSSLHELPRVPGTYAIYRRDPTPRGRIQLAANPLDPIELGPPRLVYIGSANNIRARLTDFGLNTRHPRRVSHFGQVDRLSFKVAQDRRPLEHLTREARLIRRLLPPLNRVTHRTHK